MTRARSSTRSPSRARLRKRTSLEEVAEAALVSRATAYRYFGSIEALVAEAAIERAMVDPAAVIGDREALLDRVLAAVVEPATILVDNEVAMHVMAKTMADAGSRPPTEMSHADQRGGSS